MELLRTHLLQTFVFPTVIKVRLYFSFHEFKNNYYQVIMIEESSDTESAGLPSEMSKNSKPEMNKNSKPEMSKSSKPEMSKSSKSPEKESKHEGAQVKFKKPKKFRHLRTFLRYFVTNITFTIYINLITSLLLGICIYYWHCCLHNYRVTFLTLTWAVKVSWSI